MHSCQNFLNLTHSKAAFSQHLSSLARDGGARARKPQNIKYYGRSHKKAAQKYEKLKRSRSQRSIGNARYEAVHVLTLLKKKLSHFTGGKKEWQRH